MRNEEEEKRNEEVEKKNKEEEKKNEEKKENEEEDKENEEELKENVEAQKKKDILGIVVESDSSYNFFGEDRCYCEEFQAEKGKFFVVAFYFFL